MPFKRLSRSLGETLPPKRGDIPGQSEARRKLKAYDRKNKLTRSVTRLVRKGTHEQTHMVLRKR